MTPKIEISALKQRQKARKRAWPEFSLGLERGERARVLHTGRGFSGWNLPPALEERPPRLSH